MLLFTEGNRAVTSHHMKSSILLSAGLLVLAFAFFSSLSAGVGTIGEDWRVVAILEANPNSYMQWIWVAPVLGILPVATGLILCIVDFMMRRRALNGSLRDLLLPPVGGFFVLWGIYYFLTAYGDHIRAIGWANRSNIKGINSSLQAVYAGYESIGILWSITGIFLLAIAASGIHTRRLDAKGEIRSAHALSQVKVGIV